MTDLPAPPELDPSDLAAADFSRGRKGFEPVEVRSMLGRAADALRAWQERDARQQRRIDDLERDLAAAHDLDEERITTILGEETAKVIAAARSAATEIRTRAETEAAELLERTTAEATATAEKLTSRAEALRSEAEQTRDAADAAATQLREEAAAEAAQLREEAAAEAARVRSDAAEEAAAEREAAESEATTLRNDARTTADRLREDAQQVHDELVARAASVLDERTAEAESVAASLRDTAEAELAEARSTAERLRVEADEQVAETLDRARSEGREMIAEAKRVRERVLTDLAERRRTVRRQMEAARAGRDRMVEALREVGSRLDAEVAGLGSVDQDIQEVADAAADAVLDDVDLVVAQLTAALDGPARTTAAFLDDVPDTSATGGPDSTPDDPVDPVDGAVAGSDAAAEPDRPAPVAESAVEDAPDDAGAPSTVTETGEDETPAGGETSSGEPPAAVADEDGSATVHDLFERIRAEREAADDLDGVLDGDLDDDLDDDEDEAVDDALIESELLATDTGADVIALDPGGRSPKLEVAAPTASAGAAAAALAIEERAEPDLAEEAPPVPVEADDAEPTPRTTTALDLRDELLAPAEKGLGRGLKRLASDEQNEVLDRLRRVKRGRPDLEVLLGGDGDVDRWSATLDADFAAAARAGAEFWGRAGGDSAGGVVEVPGTADALRGRVGELLGLRRALLQRVLDDADGDGLDTTELGDRIRAAYREWRSGQVPDLAGDLATAGFSLGVRAAVPLGGSWCWVPDNGGLPCADAEDNGLAGAVGCGEAFPTGDTLPPAHPGCRCIVAPAPR
jgi:cell division septum initiation protein DivIVA